MLRCQIVAHVVMLDDVQYHVLDVDVKIQINELFPNLYERLNRTVAKCINQHTAIFSNTPP